MISFGANIFSFVLQIMKIKKQLVGNNPNPSRTKKGFVPARITKTYKADILSINNKTVVTFERKNSSGQTHIIYCHGGSYIYEIDPLQWKFAEKIVKNNDIKMTVIDYPLAPEHNYKETFEMLDKTYKTLIKKYPNDQFVFLGDSAGAGLAFAFCQKLIKEKSDKLPVKNILISPWLDITMSNPEIKKLEKQDHMLNVNALKNAASKYAVAADQNQYLLSPINGELKDIPKTIIFYGTHELFYADCIKLKSLLVGVNNNFIFKEYKNMQHDWAVIPIPEGSKAIAEIGAFLKN